MGRPDYRTASRGSALSTRAFPLLRSTRFQNKKNFLNIFIPGWPDMFPWIQYILEHYLCQMYDHLPELDSDEDTFTYNVVLFLRVLIDSESGAALIPLFGNTEGFMTLIGRVWNVANAYDMPVVMRLNGIVKNMVGLEYEIDTPWIAEYEEVTSNPHFDFAPPCMERLEREISKETPDVAIIHRTLVAIVNFGRVGSKSERPMRQSGAVQKVAKVLHRLTDNAMIMKMDIETFRITKGCLHISCQYLLNSFIDSFHWVVVALECHILSAIARSCIFFHIPFGKQAKDASTKQTLESLFVQVLQAIQKHLVIRPVLRQASREIHRIDVMDGLVLRLKVDALEVWEALKALLEEFAIRKLLRDQYAWRDKAECENMQVRILPGGTSICTCALH